MSEFQYYEFQKLDGPLQIAKIKAIKNLSSRAQVGGNQARFIYNYGDFKGDPEKILAQYFDSMLNMKPLLSRKPEQFHIACALLRPA